MTIRVVAVLQLGVCHWIFRAGTPRGAA